MTLIEAAEIMEKLQRRAAHQGEVDALQTARNALLVLVSEGYATLADRLRGEGKGGSHGDVHVA